MPGHSLSCVWLQNVQTLENVGVPLGCGRLLKMWGTFEDVDVAMWCSRIVYTIPEGSWHSTNLGEKQFKMTTVVLQIGMPKITSFHTEFLGTENRHLYLELSWNWNSLKMQKIMFGEEKMKVYVFERWGLETEMVSFCSSLFLSFLVFCIFKNSRLKSHFFGVTENKHNINGDTAPFALYPHLNSSVLRMHMSSINWTKLLLMELLYFLREVKKQHSQSSRATLEMHCFS